MDTIKIKYYPAEKKIIFVGHENNDDKLYKYKEEFVLQQINGNQLCEDISSVFGSKEVKIEMITTKEDFKDFEGIVEEYNNSQEGIKISTTLLAELPDMNSLYKNIVDYGTQIIEHIKSKKIHSNAQTPIIKKVETDFFEKLERYIEKISKNIKSMEGNNINLCVTGVYSAGKSVLINAIIGYELFPKDIESKTSKAFRIKSPAVGHSSELHFCVNKTKHILQWNNEKEIFEFITEKTEDDINTIYDELIEKISEFSSKEQHQQLYEMINTLNESSEGIHDILIKYPIPLDTDAFKFTIYDTPGTDSNNIDHQNILDKALQEQTHSIMIYVIAPDKLEGTGNEKLLDALISKEGNKTNIDIDRSIFIMNKSDTVNVLELKSLQKAKIKSDNLTIELKNRKLFFLSATQGYFAKATKNKSEISEHYSPRQLFTTVDPNEKECQFYKFNRYGGSETRTNRIIQNSDEKLCSYSEDSKEEQIIVSSGLYALESEIINYGEKYSIAVRAYAIIKSVESFLSSLTKELEALEDKSEEELKTLTETIKKEKSNISSSVKEVAKELRYQEEDFNSDDLYDELHLSDEYIKKHIEDILTYAKNNLPWFNVTNSIFGNHSIDSKRAINSKFQMSQQYFYDEYAINYKKMLETKNNEFKDKIKEIVKNANIDDKFKDYVQDIDTPDVSLGYDPNINGLLEDNTADWLLWKTLDKDKFLDELRVASREIFDKLSDKLKNTLIENNETYFDEMIKNVEQNIEEYSDIIQAHINDKSAVEEFRENLSTLKSYVQEKEENLKDEIRRESNVE